MPTLIPQSGWWLLHDAAQPDTVYTLEVPLGPGVPVHLTVNRPLHLSADAVAALLAMPLPPGLRWWFTGPHTGPSGRRNAGSLAEVHARLGGE